AGYVERLVRAEPALFLTVRATGRDRLDPLHRDGPLAAEREERFEVGGILLGAEHGEVVWHQDGVEGEALEAAAMHLGRPRPVAGHADEAHLPAIARLDQRLERPARAE